MAPSTSPGERSRPRLSCSYRPSSTRRACSQALREPSTVTWLPRCSAITPRRRSISARFWPYWPKRTEARRLSSKASTICVVAVSSKAAAGGIGRSGVRKGSSGSDGDALGHIGQLAEQAVAADLGDVDGRHRADQGARRHDLHRLQIGRTADQLSGEPARLFEQDVDGTTGKTGVEDALAARDRGLQTLQPFGLLFRRDLVVHVG